MNFRHGRRFFKWNRGRPPLAREEQDREDAQGGEQQGSRPHGAAGTDHLPGKGLFSPGGKEAPSYGAPHRDGVPLTFCSQEGGPPPDNPVNHLEHIACGVHHRERAPQEGIVPRSRPYQNELARLRGRCYLPAPDRKQPGAVAEGAMPDGLRPRSCRPR